MGPDLSSSNWKIDRAVDLLHELDREVLAWMDTKPYSSYTYVNPEKTRATVNLREHNSPPIIRWSLIVADIVHNLRCALDHAFWAILQSKFPAGLPTDADRLSLPIWDSPPTSNQRRNFKPVGNEIFAVVESIQPYKHPANDVPVHPLAIIRDIDNGNKHKLLFTVMPSVAQVNIAVSKLRNPNNQGHTDVLYQDELKDGVEVVTTTFFTPEPYVEYQCVNFVAIIAIKHPAANRLGRDRDDYAALLDALIVQVRTTIVDLVGALG